MIIVWGKTAGVLLGSFGGLLGVLFGGFVGALLDVVAADFVLRRSMGRFILHGFPPTPRQFDGPAALAAAVVAYCSGPEWRPSADASKEFTERVKPWFRASRRTRIELWLSLQQRRLRRYLDAAVTLRGSFEAPKLTGIARTLLSEADLGLLIQTCVDVLAGDLHRPGADRLRNLAQDLGIDNERIDRIIPSSIAAGRPHEPSPEDCAVLGINPDANLAQVKQVYRNLAAQFHPDTLAGLTEDQRQQSAAAFVRINAAYERVCNQLESRES